MTGRGRNRAGESKERGRGGERGRERNKRVEALRSITGDGMRLV